MPVFTFRLKTVLTGVLSCLFILLLLINPETCTSAAKSGLNIALYLVLPTLFPFAVISSYICSRLVFPDFITNIFSKISGIRGESLASFLPGLISGYPVGAILLSDAYSNERITKKEAEHLLPFCNACGPLFAIGVLGGGMFGSYTIGYFLYAVHLTSVLTVCFFARRFAPRSGRGTTKQIVKTSLVRAVDKAMNSMLGVVGCIVFFSVVCQMIKLTGIFEIFGQFSSVPYGVIELTNGLNLLALSDFPMRLKLSFASFLCGFSGICILLQVQSVVKESGLSIFKYVVFKLCIGVVAFWLTWILFPIIPVSIPTFKTTTPVSMEFITCGYGFLLILLPVLKLSRLVKSAFFDKR